MQARSTAPPFCSTTRAARSARRSLSELLRREPPNTRKRTAQRSPSAMGTSRDRESIARDGCTKGAIPPPADVDGRRGHISFQAGHGRPQPPTAEHAMEDRKPTVLIVARDADTANDVATLVRSVDCIAWFAGNDETIPQAMVRLRPDVIMVDTGRPATDIDRAAAMASAINANIVLFGDEAPQL